MEEIGLLRNMSQIFTLDIFNHNSEPAFYAAGGVGVVTGFGAGVTGAGAGTDFTTGVTGGVGVTGAGAATVAGAGFTVGVTGAGIGFATGVTGVANFVSIVLMALPKLLTFSFIVT